MSEQVTVGAVVRDNKWGGKFTGTVVKIDGGSVFVQWHGTSVEDELSPSEVALAPEVENPPDNGLRPLVFHSDRLGAVTIPED